MPFNYEKFFKKYEALVGMIDQVFEKVKETHPECVQCKIECSDCCHAVFDLSLIEAMYINKHFNATFVDKLRDRLLERANQADRKAYQLKRKAHKELEKGKDENEILAEMATARIRCPMLNEQEMCDMYDKRPITCRLYGIPTEIGGKGHTCGKSGFKQGEAYPTVHLDAIQKQLYEISVEMVREMKTKYATMAEMLVPLSMAILTEYSDEYLGISEKCENTEKNIK